MVCRGKALLSVCAARIDCAAGSGRAALPARDCVRHWRCRAGLLFLALCRTFHRQHWRARDDWRAGLGRLHPGRIVDTERVPTTSANDTSGRDLLVHLRQRNRGRLPLCAGQVSARHDGVKQPQRRQTVDADDDNSRYSSVELRVPNSEIRKERACRVIGRPVERAKKFEVAAPSARRLPNAGATQPLPRKLLWSPTTT